MIRIDYSKTDPASAMKALLRHLPLSLAVREIMRMRALAEHHELETPVLDVGCGDGLFWEVVTKSYKEHTEGTLDGLLGIDINQHELRLASLRIGEKGGELKALDISDDSEIKNVDQLKSKFSTVIANCSLEHVPKLENAITNIRNFMRKDASFILFVPAPNWTDNFVVKKHLEKFSHRFAGVYGGLFDGFFQHHHLYPAYMWKFMLQGLGFSKVEIMGLGSKKANWLFESWLPPAFVSFMVKALFKRYPTFLHPLKTKYLAHEKDFLEEIRTGAIMTSNLEDPNIVEYYIRCTL